MKKVMSIILLSVCLMGSAWANIEGPREIPFIFTPSTLSPGEVSSINPTLWTPVWYNIRCQMTTHQDKDSLYLTVLSGNTITKLSLNGKTIQFSHNEFMVNKLGNYILTFTLQTNITNIKQYRLILHNASSDTVIMNDCIAITN